MNTVDKLTKSTTCDQCDLDVPAGELFVTGYVEVPISCHGETDWVPVFGTCARCAELPNGL